MHLIGSLRRRGKSLIDFFFEPKGIAVVGATPERYHGGRHLVTNLTLGYKGPIYPVNPKYNEILGLKCYPRVSEYRRSFRSCIDLYSGPSCASGLGRLHHKGCARGNCRIERFRRSGARREGPAGSVP